MSTIRVSRSLIGWKMISKNETNATLGWSRLSSPVRFCNRHMNKLCFWIPPWTTSLCRWRSLGELREHPFIKQDECNQRNLVCRIGVGIDTYSRERNQENQNEHDGPHSKLYLIPKKDNIPTASNTLDDPKMIRRRPQNDRRPHRFASGLVCRRSRDVYSCNELPFDQGCL